MDVHLYDKIAFKFSHSQCNSSARLSPGTSFANINIKSAYDIVSVHTTTVLSLHFQDHIYIDAALPFSLRSVPKLFSALADTFLRIKNNTEFQTCSRRFHHRQKISHNVRLTRTCLKDSKGTFISVHIGD